MNQINEVEMEEVMQEVDRVRKSAILKRSRASHHYSMIRWLQWVYVNQRYLLTVECLDRLHIEDGIPTRESIQTILDGAPDNPPIHFQNLTAQEFLAWIVLLR